jgi:hypothetical protein
VQIPDYQSRRIDLYDSLLLIGKPDLSPYGFKRTRTVYEHELRLPKRSAPPNEAAVRSKADAVLAEGVTAAVPVTLDVERYSIDVRLDQNHINPDRSTVAANILKLEQIIGWFKDEAPTLNVGFYDRSGHTGPGSQIFRPIVVPRATFRMFCIHEPCGLSAEFALRHGTTNCLALFRGKRCAPSVQPRPPTRAWG